MEFKMGEQRTKKVKQEEVLAQAEEQLAAIEKKEKQVKKTVLKKSEPDKGKESTKRRTKKTRGKNYKTMMVKVDREKLYELSEAIELLKKTNYAKFDVSLDLHLNFLSKKGKGEDALARGIIELPHGRGKKPKVVVLDEKKVEEIVQTKKIDFDVALATPSQMINIAKSGLARILGPKGKMPNPKYGTVTENIDETIKAIEAGKIEYRLDDGRNMHLSVGKISWDSKKIEENAKAVLAKLPASRIKSATLSATMGPGIKIKVDKK